MFAVFYNFNTSTKYDNNIPEMYTYARLLQEIIAVSFGIWKLQNFSEIRTWKIKSYYIG